VIMSICKKIMNGFSLIELAVVMLVVSVMSASALNLVSDSTSSQKVVSTKDKLNHITKAIQVYINKNNMLPCPAQSDLGFNEASFGKSVTTSSGTVCVTSSTYAQTDASTTNLNIVAGSVPVLTLGLPADYMFDEWKRRISYVVDQDMITSANWIDLSIRPNIRIMKGKSGGSKVDAMFRSPTESELSTNLAYCYDTGSNQSISGYTTQIPICAAFALVSHGPNGHRAMNAKGNDWRAALKKGTDEEENTSYSISLGEAFDNVFYDLDLELKNNSNYFDDIITYRSKYQLRGYNARELNYDCITAGYDGPASGADDVNDCYFICSDNAETTSYGSVTYSNSPETAPDTSTCTFNCSIMDSNCTGGFVTDESQCSCSTCSQNECLIHNCMTYNSINYYFYEERTCSSGSFGLPSYGFSASTNPCSGDNTYTTTSATTSKFVCDSLSNIDVQHKLVSGSTFLTINGSGSCPTDTSSDLTSEANSSPSGGHTSCTSVSESYDCTGAGYDGPATGAANVSECYYTCSNYSESTSYGSVSYSSSGNQNSLSSCTFNCSTMDSSCSGGTVTDESSCSCSSCVAEYGTCTLSPDNCCSGYVCTDSGFSGYQCQVDSSSSGSESSSTSSTSSSSSSGSCVGDGGTCTQSPDNCCSGYTCTYNFFGGTYECSSSSSSSGFESSSSGFGSSSSSGSSPSSSGSCVGDGGTCTQSPDNCCSGYTCTYNFFGGTYECSSSSSSSGFESSSSGFGSSSSSGSSPSSSSSGFMGL
jgi:prepilin-type N-terminal cleavage/methylation domain-containing protein